MHPPPRCIGGWLPPGAAPPGSVPLTSQVLRPCRLSVCRHLLPNPPSHPLPLAAGSVHAAASQRNAGAFVSRLSRWVGGFLAADGQRHGSADLSAALLATSLLLLGHASDTPYLLAPAKSASGSPSASGSVACLGDGEGNGLAVVSLPPPAPPPLPLPRAAPACLLRAKPRASQRASSH